MILLTWINLLPYGFVLQPSFEVKKGPILSFGQLWWFLPAASRSHAATTASEAFSWSMKYSPLLWVFVAHSGINCIWSIYAMKRKVLARSHKGQTNSAKQCTSFQTTEHTKELRSSWFVGAFGFLWASTFLGSGCIPSGKKSMQKKTTTNMPTAIFFGSHVRPVAFKSENTLRYFCSIPSQMAYPPNTSSLMEMV